MSEMGLLQGLNAGLSKGLEGYVAERDRRDKRAMAEKEQETKEKMIARQMVNDELDAKVKIGGLLKGGDAQIVNDKTPKNFSRLKVGDTEIAFNPQNTKKDTADSGRNFTQAAELRKEYLGIPTSKASQDVASSYGKIKSAALNPSPAGDLSLIFNYMKMLDPGSTVREGEFANAQNAASIPDRIRNQYNMAMKGERLGDENRADFVAQSGRILRSQMEAQKALESQYRNKATGFQLDPELVLTNFFANIDPNELESLPKGLLEAAAKKAQEDPSTMARIGPALKEFFGGSKKATGAAPVKETLAGPVGLLPKAPVLDPEDQAALNFANENPKDPRSAAIKAKLGVK